MGPILADAALLRYSSAIKIVCDGNSLTESHGSGTPYPLQLAALAPLNGACTVVNLGISGQTTRHMNGLDGFSSADVDGAFDATKAACVLAALEGTNSMSAQSGNRTPRQAADDMKDYVAARLAAHPYLFLLMTCPPRQTSGYNDAQNAAANANIDAYNAILRSEYRAWGVKVLVDLRQPGSPWSAANFPDYTATTFATSAAAGWWAASEVGTGGLTHFSTAGYGAIARMVAAGLRRMPRR